MKIVKIIYLTAIHVLAIFGVMWLTIGGGMFFEFTPIEEGPEFVADADKIVYFSAAWCKPCKYYGPGLKKRAIEHHIPLEEIDLTKDEDMYHYQKKYGIDALPHTWFIKGNDTIRKIGS